MSRARARDDRECIGLPTCEDGKNRWLHHFGCPLWDASLLTPTGEGLRPHRTFLGSRRVPYAAWAKTATMYVWPLWRNWTAPKVVKVETSAQVRARHLATKPTFGYSWRIEKLTPAQRRAFAVSA